MARACIFPRISLLASFVTLTACAASPLPQESAQPAAATVSTVSLNVGLRQYGDDLLEDAELDEHTSVGIEFDSYSRTAPIGWELGLSYSSEDESAGGISVEVTGLELYGGVRKTWETGSGRLRPYLGGGLSALNGEIEASISGDGSDSDDDTSLGAYLHGGVRFQATDAVSLGADLRYRLGTDFDIDGLDIDSDFFQMAVTLGFSF
jgi:opacity protein-like surface antigen